MNPPIRLEPHLTVDELRQQYLAARDANLRTRWHAMWLLAQGRSGHEVGRILCRAPSTIGRWARQYNAAGPSGLRDRRADARGRPGLLSRLNPAQRERLEQSLEDGEAPPEVGGGLWHGPKVARWLELALGRERGSLDDKQGWRALRQLGFSRQRPRPRHPDADPQAQEAWKKGASKQP